MKELDLENKCPGVKEVRDAIQPCKDLLNSVFSRLHLKDKRFKTFAAASNELREMADNVRKIDQHFDTTLLLDSSRSCPKPSGALKPFMERHCRSGQYLFSVKKCGDDECVCGLPRDPPQVFTELDHLPFPVPEREHYKFFEV